MLDTNNNDNTFNHSNSIQQRTSFDFGKIKYDSEGHITDFRSIEKSDITALGIPGSDTTYGADRGITKVNGNFGHSNSIAQQNSPALKKIAFNDYGHITSVANVEAADLPNHTHTSSDITFENGFDNMVLDSLVEILTVMNQYYR